MSGDQNLRPGDSCELTRPDVSDLPVTYVLPDSYGTLVHDIQLFVKNDKPVLVSGATGCGKSSLLRHIAALHGRRNAPEIISVQLCRDIDGRSLLGSYHCTEIGGEFRWIPGLLVTAVVSSAWLVLEDLDSVPLDVVSVLLPLLQTKKIYVSDLGKTFAAGPGFRIFATLRTHDAVLPAGQAFSSLLRYFRCLQLPVLSSQELLLVCKQIFPSAELLLPKLLEIFTSVTTPGALPDADLRRMVAARIVSVRDLFKIGVRLSHYPACDRMDRVDIIFRDICDCLAAYIPASDRRVLLAQQLGAVLGLPNSEVNFYCRTFEPVILEGNDSFQIGRAVLPAALQHENAPVHADRQSAFSLHPSVKRLMESIGAAVKNNEAILLVGETGTGKTTSVQYLANRLGHRLHVVNLSHQAESSDLLGGYKPVEMARLLSPLLQEFLDLFALTFSSRKNEAFLRNCEDAFAQKFWSVLVKGMRHTANAAGAKRMQNGQAGVDQGAWNRWNSFSDRLLVVEKQLAFDRKSLLFTFLEGNLVKAFQSGDWVLLDEINLATPELLSSLHYIIDSTSSSFILADRGDSTPITRHKDFRLFACMNPATDMGKRDLPSSTRSRFTEIFCDELTDKQEVRQVVISVLSPLGLNVDIIERIVSLYFELRNLADTKMVDGVNHKPHYSLRNYTQALKFALRNPMGNVMRSLYEGFCLSYLTQLNRASQKLMKQTIEANLLGNEGRHVLSIPAIRPTSGDHVSVEGYWIPRGNQVPAKDEKYILTETVKNNLAEIARAVSAGQIPVLLQGETSIGKTSMITWLARATGNHCVRINNHEHTDLQDYIGSYQSDEHGKLVFREGVLVDAVRKGYWIILDELNLAPTDVLEALNRLLDANRELLITETQEVVKAHPHFMLFATQNPPGYYGGRKTLSRAFRNRFIEMHFDEIPATELERILEQRCQLAPTHAKKMIAVMTELQALRKNSGIFAGKQGFITLRDLFRWGQRYRLAENKAYDWSQHLPIHGYMLLAGRVRKPEEEAAIKATLKKHFGESVDFSSLFSVTSGSPHPANASVIQDFIKYTGEDFSHLVWTSNLQRLAVLIGNALEYGEPVLLIGETGCGKTTVCQMYAALRKAHLYAVNCHSNTETSDFLGGLRPARSHESSGKLFEWQDGPLVDAMQKGGVMLLDEISLADDSVLERINSVLEPERSLVLTEKGTSTRRSAQANEGSRLQTSAKLKTGKSREEVPNVELSGQNFKRTWVEESSVEIINAVPEFRLVATMNPGGDFGKKELSPALRNRFTEIWCDNLSVPHDLTLIIQKNLFKGTSLSGDHSLRALLQAAMMKFIVWLQTRAPRVMINGRDIMNWIGFINGAVSDTNSSLFRAVDPSPFLAYLHGTLLVFENSLTSTTRHDGGVDGSDSAVIAQFVLQQGSSEPFERFYLERNIPAPFSSLQLPVNVIDSAEFFGIHPFVARKREVSVSVTALPYSFQSVSVRRNLLRILRGLTVSRAVLLEGPPGVGKTSIVNALAQAAGYPVVRINLSEQTDISELFGADAPVEGDISEGLFSWRDGPFLTALKQGAWILLDELNLATQSVLEGLNACLDHRGEIFVPELGKTFRVDSQTTRIFACQNPVFQGSGRKGLPRSFLNRFSQVYMEALTAADLLCICGGLYPDIPREKLEKMLVFNRAVEKQIEERQLGQSGQPWEFNLRDVLRWCQLVRGGFMPDVAALDLLYASRFRSAEDRALVWKMADEILDGLSLSSTRQFLRTEVAKQTVCFGSITLPRKKVDLGEDLAEIRPLQLLHSQSAVLEKLAACVQYNFVCILVGNEGCGKTSLVQLMAGICGETLMVTYVNAATDASELLGGFEQRTMDKCLADLRTACKKLLITSTGLAANTSNLLKQFAGEKELGHSREELEGKLFQLNVILEKMLQNDPGREEEVRLCVQAAKKSAEMLEEKGRGRFDWCDSVVVNALQQGSWLLMDNANLCSAAVLDRLNSVLEPSGELLMSERGAVNGIVPVIRAHPNFRLFLTMDPKFGELSRAMRNRGIEVFVPVIEHLRDEVAVLKQLGLQDEQIPLVQRSCGQINDGRRGLVEKVKRTGEDVVMRMQDGLALEDAIRQSGGVGAIEAVVVSEEEKQLASLVLPVVLSDVLGKLSLSNALRHKEAFLFALQAGKSGLSTHASSEDRKYVFDTLLAAVIQTYVQNCPMEDFVVRSKVLLETMNDLPLYVNSIWTSRSSQLIRSSKPLLKSPFALAGTRLLMEWTCRIWPDHCRTGFGAALAAQEDLEDFFSGFREVVLECLRAERLLTDEHDAGTLNKWLFAGVWMRILWSSLSSTTPRTGRSVFSVLWKLFHKHVLSVFAGTMQLSARLCYQREKLDLDLKMVEDKLRNRLRKRLSHPVPFATEGDFASYKFLMGLSEKLAAEKDGNLGAHSGWSYLFYRDFDLLIVSDLPAVLSDADNASRQLRTLNEIEFLAAIVRHESLDGEEILRRCVGAASGMPHAVLQIMVNVALSLPTMCLTPLAKFSLVYSLENFLLMDDGITDPSQLSEKKLIMSSTKALFGLEATRLLYGHDQNHLIGAVSSSLACTHLGDLVERARLLETFRVSLWHKFAAESGDWRHTFSMGPVLDFLRRIIPEVQPVETSPLSLLESVCCSDILQEPRYSDIEGELLEVARNLVQPSVASQSQTDAVNGEPLDKRRNEFIGVVLLGICTMKVTMPPTVDPVEKQRIKRRCLTQQKGECETVVSTVGNYFTGLYGSPAEENYDNELVQPYKVQTKLIGEKLDGLSSEPLIYRPVPSSYEAAIQDAQYLRSSTLQMAKNVFQKYAQGTDVVGELEMWLVSLVGLTGEFCKKYVVYSDMLAPFISGAQQVITGFRRRLQVFREEAFMRRTRLTADIFPVKKSFSPLSFLLPPDSTENYLTCAKRLWSNRQQILRFFAQTSEESLVTEIQLIKHVLLLVRAYLSAEGMVGDCRSFSVLVLTRSVFGRVAAIWTDIETARKEALLKKDELYKFSAAEKENGADFFPSFQQEFADLIPEDPTGENSERTKTLRDGKMEFFTADVQNELVELHRSVTLGKPEQTTAGKYDGQSDLMASANYFKAKIVALRCVELDLSGDLPDYLVECHCTLESLSGNVTARASGRKGFYYEPNLAEAKTCLPALHDVKRRVQSLLEEWPSHPVLNEAMVVCDRILGFSILAPLAQYLTGVELLRDKCEHWEAKAHSGVSLQPQLEALAQVIVSWRKLELRDWSNALDTAQEDKFRSVSKWWLLLFSTIRESIDNMENDLGRLDQTVQSLEKFMESSALGDFEARLELLDLMAKHFCLEPVKSSQFSKRGVIVNILRNIHSFYNQFCRSVSDQLKSKRAVIEKQLKDFVKVARWSDMNYWSLKNDIEKSHKAVLKNVRLFQAVLDEPVYLVPVEKSVATRSAENWTQIYCRLPALVEISVSSVEKAGIGISDLPVKLKKARKMIRGLVRDSPYPPILEVLTNIAVDAVARDQALADPTFAAVIPADARKKTLKSLVQRRRLAFTDLSKTLSTLGLSWRKGATWAASTTPGTSFSVDADIFSPSDDALDPLRQRCGEVYFQTVSHLALFRKHLEKPTKNIPANVVASMRGFVEHLRRLIMDESRTLAKYSGDLRLLRSLLQSSKAVSEHSVSQLPSSSGFALFDLAVEASSLVCDISTTAESYLLLLDAVPGEEQIRGISETQKKVFEVLYRDSGPVLTKDSPNWKTAREALKKARDMPEKYAAQLQAHHGNMARKKDSSDIYGPAEWVYLQQLVVELSEFVENAAVVSSLLPKACRSGLEMSAARTQRFLDNTASLASLSVDHKSEQHEALQRDARRLLLACLRGVEDMYKSRMKRKTLGEIEAELEDRMLSSSLVDGFSADYEQSNLQKVALRVRTMVKVCNTAVWSPVVTNTILVCHKFLECYHVLVGNLLCDSLVLMESSCQLLLVLLKLYSQILTNGFGNTDVPEEEESVEGNGKFEESEQAGLGEGEGAKDVSEQIESQDQLEDTKLPGEKEEKADAAGQIADEEHGIEMDDDFDAEMNDVAKEEIGEDDEEESQEQNPEVDDQLGEFEDQDDTVENLDKELWADNDQDEADDDEDSEKDKKEGEGAGEAQNDKQDLMPADADLQAAKDGQQDDQAAQNQQPEPEGEPQDAENESGIEEMDIEPGNEQNDEETPADKSDEPDLMEKGAEDEADAEDDNMQHSEDAAADELDENLVEDENNAEKGQIAEELPEEESVQQPASASAPQTSSKDKVTGGGHGGGDDLSASDTTFPETEANMDTEQNENDANASNDATGAGTGTSLDSLGQNVSSQPLSSVPPSQRRRLPEKRPLEKSAQQERTLGNTKEAYRKRLRITQNEKDTRAQTEKQQTTGEESDLYEHVQSEKEKYDGQAVDAASKDDALKQQEERLDELHLREDEEMNPEPEEDEKPDAEEQENAVIKPKDVGKRREGTATGKEMKQLEQNPETGDVEKMEIPGDFVETASVVNEAVSFFGVREDMMLPRMRSEVDVELLRTDLLEQMAQWSRNPQSAQDEQFALDLWRKYEAVTLGLAYEFCEQLRLILEPTKKSKLRGDYRTGKRLNMRKIMAYVASEFRKDKIWLRRTQPNQRQYQVLIAVDDSSSMADNRTKELAFESVAVMSHALSLLEVGELSVCSFGQTAKVLHRFDVPFTTQDGARVLTDFSFSQAKTNVAQMLNEVAGVFDSARSRLFNVTQVSQLLLIVSDGRGIFQEGVETVKKAIRQLVNLGVFVVFIILDNPDGSSQQKSIMDIRAPVFGGPGQIEMRSYMQDFPFPFYLVLRNVRQLPSTLCDALRQWFELIASHD